MAPSLMPSTLLYLTLLLQTFTGQALSADVHQRGVVTPGKAVVPSGGVLGTCPSANGTQYSTPAGTYLVQCDLDYHGWNIDGLNGQLVATFQSCLDMCASNGNCVTIAYLSSSSRCWMHSKITVPTPQIGNWGAVLINNATSSSSVTTSTTSICSAGTVTVTAVSTPAASTVTSTTISTAPASTVTSTTISTAPASTVTTTTLSATTVTKTISVSSSSTSSSATALATLNMASGVTCPDNDGKLFSDPQGVTYQIQCDVDHTGSDLYCNRQNDFGSCVSACFGVGSHTCFAVAWIVGVPGNNVNCCFKSNSAPLPPKTSDKNFVYPVHSAVMVSAPDCANMSCPANTAQWCTSNGQLFKMSCASSYSYTGAGLLANVKASSLSACLNFCSTFYSTTCIGVNFDPANTALGCQMFSAVTAVASSSGYSALSYNAQTGGSVHVLN